MKSAITLPAGGVLEKDRHMPFIRENGKLIAQFFLTTLFIGLGIWFIKHEHHEIKDVRNLLASSNIPWLLIGIAVTLIYILLQSLMYVFSFRSIQCRVGIFDAMNLFLKRNFISVFLPAGGVSSLAFFTGDIEKKGITKSQIHFASSVYGFVGILSVVIVAIPVFFYGILVGNSQEKEWIALFAVVLIIAALIYVSSSILHKGNIYRLLVRIFPSFEIFMVDIEDNKIDKKQFIITVLISVFIEFVGITHLFIAMKALHYTPSLYAAIMGYIVAVVFMIISPFLRGLGAVEVSTAFILTRFGFSNIESIAITLLYRFLEFWLPLLSGIIAFISKINKLLMRIIPAALIFLLGIINIISVLTPAIAWRVERLHQFLLMDTIRASNYFVMVAGFFLLITAAFMLKGLRMAWGIALFLSIISFIGHITKAIDYEEASVALLVIVILFFTHKEYYIKSNPRLRFVGIQTALYSVAAILVYGTIGFYFLDKRHFNVDFNWLQSFRYTLQNFVLVGNPDLVPYDKFAKNFLLSINISGFMSLAFLTYTLIRPYVYSENAAPEEITKAKDLLNRYGNSSVDYFKTYSDKLIFVPPDIEAFIAYRISGSYAVVLEGPVATDVSVKKQCITLFDRFCFENGLKSLYYRVSEENLPDFKACNKRNLFIGQEAVVDLNTFSLEGGSRKSLRNAVNKVKERGYKSTVHTPPIKDGLLQKLKSVSDEWLTDTERSEIIFSQGMFVWDELKQQNILTVENPEEKIVAFLNIIPDYAKNESTYDLLRKTSDAPNGIMDFILLELFNYLKSQGYQYVNLGFAPMSGINDTHSFTEKSMKFAYEKIRSFQQYKGLRDFKDKFDPTWYNKYLVYDQDYDLLQVPAVLSRVIKP